METPKKVVEEFHSEVDDLFNRMNDALDDMPAGEGRMWFYKGIKSLGQALYNLNYSKKNL